MRNTLLFISLILLGCLPVAFAQHTNTIFLSKEDNTKNKFIVVSPPDSVETTAFMYLIPGSFEQPEDVLIQTTLPRLAAEKGILVFIPVFETGVTAFAIDDSTQHSFRKMLDYCVKQYKLEGKDFYLGGYSMGGTCAIKYAELAVKNNYPIKPAAVFAVDPPLDFSRFYNAAQRNLRLTKGFSANPELVYMTDRIAKKMKGTPATAQKNYFEASPYSFDDTTQAAVKLLIKIPVTIYTEPDIDWWMQARGFDYSNINSPDGAAMVNELHLLGNRSARFIPTADKGYRYPNHNRHPHSWSILDPTDLFTWFNTLK
ncbi:hypothetical protein [Chitinophaga sp.]|uniref:hypothetical protein n=1 Tax=Chitinophaga sp. TaxID=1869181 RepID=UPI002F957474